MACASSRDAGKQLSAPDSATPPRSRNAGSRSVTPLNLCEMVAGSGLGCGATPFTLSSSQEKTGSATTAIPLVAGRRVAVALRNHATVEAEGNVASSCSTIKGVMDERRVAPRPEFVRVAIEVLRGSG